MEENAMPKTKGESIFFTAITAWMMVYVMTLYNTAIAMGSFTNAAFLIALKEMCVLQNSLGNCHTEPSSLNSADSRGLFS